MKTTGFHFTVVHRGTKIEIEIYKSGASEVYKAGVANDQPLFLTKSKNTAGYNWWTSIPKSRLELAREIGPLIDSYNTTMENKTTPKQTFLF